MNDDARFNLAQFDYALAPEQIAHAPIEPRDHSRLMVLDGAQPPADRRFDDLPAHLQAGDLLVINRTQVIPARLPVRRVNGGRSELLLHTPVDAPLQTACLWEALGRPARALLPGSVLTTEGGAKLTVERRVGPAIFVRGATPLWPLLQIDGQLPLPPYVQRAHGPTVQDAQDYQSIFAKYPGAVAAPTASLHFTPRLMQALSARGVRVAEVTLHVGPGTFLPIRPEHALDVRQHVMHPEYYEVPEATQHAVAQACAQGKRVVAVGTTALRALESWGTAGSACGTSRLFIYPGYRFAVVHGLVTNFHLPRSTLLLLVAAMAGRERILAAYAQAIASGYRFFSYGDAMLLLGVH